MNQTWLNVLMGTMCLFLAIGFFAVVFTRSTTPEISIEVLPFPHEVTLPMADHWPINNEGTPLVFTIQGGKYGAAVKTGNGIIFISPETSRVFTREHALR